MLREEKSTHHPARISSIHTIIVHHLVEVGWTLMLAHPGAMISSAHDATLIACGDSHLVSQVQEMMGLRISNHETELNIASEKCQHICSVQKQRQNSQMQTSRLLSCDGKTRGLHSATSRETLIPSQDYNQDHQSNFRVSANIMHIYFLPAHLSKFIKTQQAAQYLKRRCTSIWKHGIPLTT